MTYSLSVSALLLLVAVDTAEEPKFGRELALLTRQPDDTTYSALRRLESAELVTSRLDASGWGPQRRFYSPTAKGFTEAERVLFALDELGGADAVRRNAVLMPRRSRSFYGTPDALP